MTMNCEHCNCTKAKEWHLVCDACWKELPGELAKELVEAHESGVGTPRHKAAIGASLHFLEVKRISECLESQADQ